MPLARLLPLVLAVAGASVALAPASGATPSRAASVRHTRLLRSSPSAGAVLAAPPGTISLWFSKPVQARLTRLQLTTAQGAAVALEPPRTSDAGDTVVVAALKGGLAKGSYTVTWATTSRDSHVIKGSYQFSVQGTAASN